MTTPTRILDTGALLSYTSETDPHVAYQLVVCADRDTQMYTSVLCVAEAYQRADHNAADLLDILLGLPALATIECRANDGYMVGHLAKKVGSLSLAHACLLAFSEDVPLITTKGSGARKVLDDELIWELLTRIESQRSCHPPISG